MGHVLALQPCPSAPRGRDAARTPNPGSNRALLQCSGEHALTPIIYPPTLLDTATRQKALPCAGVFFRKINLYVKLKKSTFLHTTVLRVASGKLTLCVFRISRFRTCGRGGGSGGVPTQVTARASGPPGHYS